MLRKAAWAVGAVGNAKSLQAAAGNRGRLRFSVTGGGPVFGGAQDKELVGRLDPERRARLERVRAALSKRAGDVELVTSHVVREVIERGLDSLRSGHRNASQRHTKPALDSGPGRLSGPGRSVQQKMNDLPSDSGVRPYLPRSPLRSGNSFSASVTRTAFTCVMPSGSTTSVIIDRASVESSTYTTNLTAVLSRVFDVS